RRASQRGRAGLLGRARIAVRRHCRDSASRAGRRAVVARGVSRGARLSTSEAVRLGRSGCPSRRTAVQAALGYRGGLMSSLLFAHTAVGAADEHRDLVPETRADSTETDQLRDSTCRVAGSLLDNFSNEPKLLRVRYLSPLATFAVDF